MLIRLTTGIALWAAVFFSAIAMSRERQPPAVNIGNMKEVQEAALHMIHEGTTQDEMFVMTFSKEVETASEITTNRVELQTSMFGVKPKGTTALWDCGRPDEA